ncbi:DUF748 domain-containing protein [Celerinatantimonas diazotrophica]|uniref:Uncharacterized protein DUF748 n=1 Tax=Celerinatantimonas diazotrophica TaxID=412034 RepID=A0A4R1K4L0_9GAMM|nr:DUF748 domain-containing protein [Celerinatantimonas diazotrophica]TCK59062.1 uncharacterized protein DUF748 [Celerinatantimonas diazotrophica]CAG9297697.1 hypothetical protein CEDIAZO_02886 [Celerinatantimonas diazotrophica]
MFKSAYKKFKSFPIWLKITSYGVILYGIYLILLGLVAPYVIQTQLPSALQTMLGREVSLAKVSINPFLLRARIDDLSVAKSESSKKLFALKRLEVEVNFWQSLLTLNPTLSHINIDAPDVMFSRQQDGSLSFQDILTRFAQRAKKQPKETHDDGKIFALRIGKISLLNGQFAFTDSATGTHLHYQKLHFNLNHFDTRALISSHQTDKPHNKFDLKLTGQQQGQMNLTGQLQLSPFKAVGHLSVQRVALTPYWQLIQPYIRAQFAHGTLTTKLLFAVNVQKNGLQWQLNDGSLALNNLQWQDKTQPKVSLAHIKLSHINASSADKSASIGQVVLSKPQVEAVLKNNSLDLVRLFTPKWPASSSTKSAPSQGQSAAPWQASLDQVSLEDGSVSLVDDDFGQGTRWDIKKISLKTGQLSSDLSRAIKYQLSLALMSPSHQNAGQLSSSGEIVPQTQSVRAKLKLSDFDLTTLGAYITPYVNIQLHSGQLSSVAQLRFSPKQQFDYQGNLALTQLSIDDNVTDKPLLKWQKMAINSVHFSQAKNILDIKQIQLTKPFLRVVVTPKRQTNLSHLLVSHQAAKPSSHQAKEPPQTAATKSAANPLKINIGKISLSQGRAFFADRSITPNFASGIDSLNGDISHLSSKPGTVAKVHLKGAIDQYAPVTLSGEINPLLKQPYLNLDLNFKNVELVSVSPYSGTYAGYYIDKGQLDLGLNYQLKDNQLLGKNHIVINQLQLGKASNSSKAMNLPIKLAIALLQDRHGVIDLGVQVSGDVNDPSFGVGSIIWAAIKNVITKAVMSPFSLLAKLVGSDQQLNYVAFAPGRAMLDKSEQQRLDKLAEALKKRPKLKVNVRGSVNLAQDALAISEFKLKQQLLKVSGLAKLPKDLSASQFPMQGPLVDGLDKLYTSQLKKSVKATRKKIVAQIKAQQGGKEPSAEQVTTAVHISMYNQLIKVQKVPKSQLQNLAQIRAQQVKSYLVNHDKIDPDRIFLRNSKAELKTDSTKVKLQITE